MAPGNRAAEMLIADALKLISQPSSLKPDDDIVADFDELREKLAPSHSPSEESAPNETEGSHG